jgi:hypothetical protein
MSPGEGTDRPATPEPRWRRQQRLDAVFGDVLPETTGDERDTDAQGSDPGGTGPRPGRRRESAQDRWWRDQVPPHHGS